MPDAYASRVPSGEMATLPPPDPALTSGGNDTSAPKSTSSRISGRSTGRVSRHGPHSATPATAVITPAAITPAACSPAVIQGNLPCREVAFNEAGVVLPGSNTAVI